MKMNGLHQIMFRIPLSTRESVWVRTAIINGEGKSIVSSAEAGGGRRDNALGEWRPAGWATGVGEGHWIPGPFPLLRHLTSDLVPS